MAFITLYSYNPNPTTLRTVFYDSDNPSYVSYTDHGASGSVPQPPPTASLGVHCFGVDQYIYHSQTSPPYAVATINANAPECGYVPPTCDIAIVSETKTDETVSVANNGTANFFCTTSFPVITYYLWNSLGFVISNTTGYFTGLAPDDYYINAFDANGCGQSFHFTIQPFDTTKTHFKYRLTFNSRDGLTQFEMRLYDMRNNYDGSLYPKDISGTDSPVTFKAGDPNEDKTTAIISNNVTINLWYTGLDFTPDEFTAVPEQSWFVQVYIVPIGHILFQGWVLPDECQDSYMDAPYPFTITATDGLPSLKGNSFGDGSGGQGYGTFQIPQYGLTQWCKLIKQCLDQLGYNYGVVRVISSLRYNATYDRNLWLNIGTWSDILYDSSGKAVDTYTALELLLSGLKLCLISSGGSFFLVNWNDLWYINNGVVTDEYLRCFYEFAEDFSNIEATGADVLQPLQQSIGFDQPFTLLNPPQGLIKDKAYNIEADVSFNVLALLFENNSFEIGAIQGELPPGFETGGTLLTAYCNYDPILPDVPFSGAYSGNWELRLSSLYNPSADIPNNYITLITNIPIDQPNLQANLSFQWRPQFLSSFANSVHSYVLIFHCTDTGNSYFYALETFLTVHAGWNLYTGGSIFSINGSPRVIEPEIIPWQSHNMTTLPFPDTGIGYVNFFFLQNGVVVDSGHSVATGTQLIVDIDDFNLTTSTSFTGVADQVGETHTETAVTGIPLANLKQYNPSLFTFPTNKRVAGNVFYGHDYGTGQVQNLWNFALKSADPQDRLAATVSRSIARNYFYNMRKFEGSVSAAVLQYYGIFTLRFYDGELYIPFKLEGDLRNSIWNVVLIQISDSDAQFIYQYLPIYQRNSRSNG